jgi:hypothetical protein
LCYVVGERIENEVDFGPSDRAHICCLGAFQSFREGFHRTRGSPLIRAIRAIRGPFRFSLRLHRLDRAIATGEIMESPSTAAGVALSGVEPSRVFVAVVIDVELESDVHLAQVAGCGPG